MCKRLALFPMTKDLCAVARHAAMLQGYTLSHILAPAYTGLAGQDVSLADGGSTCGVSFAAYSEDTLADCDVLLVDYDENMKELDIYQSATDTARRLGKEVILTRKLAQLLNAPEDVCDTAAGTWPTNIPEQLYEIDVPVITVLSQGPRTDQLAVELTLRKHFMDAGYKVAQLSSHIAGTLFGFDSLPTFLYEQRDAYDKMLRFNHYVKDMTQAASPDVLIMGAPEGIMKYNNNVLMGMGYLPQIICDAVPSDLPVLCMYHAKYNKLYLDDISLFGQYRLGAAIQHFHAANSFFSAQSTALSLKKEYTDLKSDFVLHSLKDVKVTDYHLVNVLDAASAQGLFRAMQDELTDNACAV